MNRVVFVFIFLLFCIVTKAQTPKVGVSDLQNFNTITTAVPFLLITPDSRSSAMGDVGVATSPDINSTFHNPAKLIFMKTDGLYKNEKNEKNKQSDKFGFSFSYSPWLRNLVHDMALMYLTGYYALNEKQVLTSSFRYFSLGSITFTDQRGNTLRNFKPNEFSLDLSFSQAFGRNFSSGVAFRYIYSNLTGGLDASGNNSANPVQSFSADVFAFYKFDEINLKGKDLKINLGAKISNLGAKVNYSSSGTSDFIPTLLKIGGAATIDLDKYNSITYSLDFQKLLVPSPPVYSIDSLGNKTILSGKDPNVSPVQGVFQSFYDAPNGFSQELKEINISTGIEYLYNKQFALRLGYFYESPTSGSRQYLSGGIGIAFSKLNINASYLVSTSSSTVQNPLASTIRLTLGFTL